MSRPVSLIDWNNPPQLQNEEFVVETSYDALNRPLTLTQPDGKVISYSYDKGRLLKTVRADAVLHVSNITYNPKGQREHIYFGNNTKTRYEYNPLNFRLTRLLTTRNNGQDILQDLNYSYDPVGNIIQQRDNAQQTHYFANQQMEPVSSYEYDALYRLIKATGRELTSLTAPNENDFVNNISVPNPAANAMQNYAHNYQYDALGNILQDAWKNYQYATANNYLLGNNNIANQYSYDAHGNMLTMPHLSSMVYDYQNQLVSASNGTFNSYYNYDAGGNRTRKVVDKGYIREERYYVGGYEIYRKYVNDTLDLERSTVNVSDDEKVFVRIETKTGEAPLVRYQYDNHLGSACLELDKIGAIISYEEYHPFGTTSYRSGRSETEVSLKRYKYCGKERDEETGLYYYGMRYYAAWLCRFINVDPLQFKYPYYTPCQYAGNKPISYIDLDGGEEKKVESIELKPVVHKVDPQGGLGHAINSNIRELPTTPVPLPTSYTVQKGDNLTKIAKQINAGFGTNLTIEDIAKANKIKDPNKINVGQQIILPGQNIELQFNLKELKVYDKTYSIDIPGLSWQGTSGRDGYQKPEFQSKKDKGPIPEGSYMVDPANTQKWNNISTFQKAIANIARGEWRGGTNSWGNIRTWITPMDGTNTYGRANFSIHGGKTPGSAGCIDLTSKNDSFHNWLKSYGNPIELNVKY